MTPEEELAAATDCILASTARRKLVIAGPGAGKTWTFKRLLERAAGSSESRLVLTFINSLTADLQRDLSSLATVRTFHGFCFGALKQSQQLRPGLRDDFIVLPQLAEIIKDDWRYAGRGTTAPTFIDAMRSLDPSVDQSFFLDRSDYYNAVGFDDVVYRVHKAWAASPELVPSKHLLLVDEFQDFNPLEAKVIEQLAEKSPIVIAGDDDQALYGQLRRATWDYIRELHGRGDYEVFELPFCMRCTEVIVGAVSDIIATATGLGKLSGRIAKRYEHYPPQKQADSTAYPYIDHVHCSVQSKGVNYFGRYIEQEVRRIPPEEVTAALEAHNAPALVIGQSQYLDQIEAHLRSAGLAVERSRSEKTPLTREIGLRLLRGDPDSNLGWRIVLAPQYAASAGSVIRRSIKERVLLAALLEPDFREAVLAEAQALPDLAAQPAQATEPEGLYVKIVTFEGAKGLSAQHVYVVGLHEGELPRNAASITDREVCLFLVALTRAKKKCTVMETGRFATAWKQPSIFLSWIRATRLRLVTVNKGFWGRS